VPRHELGLNIALIPVVDTPIDVSNVDPTMLFSVTDYAHLRAAFIGRRQSYLPAELINISIEHLPNLGEVFDVKEALWDMDPDVPQWLADRTNLVINPNPCRRYKQA
ncbi:MAG TPA: hypothetical protein VLA12_13155, partial [Planctomycetaceae bacterium]|nr:hypothetical protein [Planctomycetaceae bacterium]